MRMHIALILIPSRAGVEPDSSAKIPTTSATTTFASTNGINTTATTNAIVPDNTTAINNETEIKPVLSKHNNDTPSDNNFLFRRIIKEEWFVKNSTDAGSCVPRPCPIGELMFEKKCINITDNTVCNEGQMLYVDFTGLVHCDCKPNFIYDPWSGNCFALGDQGYCNFGQHLVMGANGTVNCEKNPCYLNGYAFHNDTKICYRKMFRGFCDEGFLIVHEVNRTAECGAIVAHSIFDLPTMRSCNGGTIRDYTGTCREQFTVPVSSFYPVMYGQCPLGFMKDPQGDCRKIHKLFG
ncbi:hypothetical protein SK128_019483 [Halocaridina rubra]|uniref:DUF4789 domain-containing protein n=1 Tax=Halocaridina rubra TaxID=373956 RepID=A0AAN8X2R7_HALRR